IRRIDQQLYAEKSSLENRAYTVITTLKEKAANTQAFLISYLKAKSSTDVIEFKSFWIVNMLMVEAVPSVIYEIADMPEIWYIDWDSELDWDKPVNESPASTRANSSEIGLKRINAHKMWESGYTGAGKIVMNIDTGVDGNHPALNYKWRGSHVPASQAWFDPDGSSFPFDNESHGTHTMGIMTGIDPTTNDTVGVAPGAEWIAARTIGPSGNFQSNNVAAYQWAMDTDR
ncbi:MAG: S8 family serine peptidase, partial [Aliifodinibius sp.]|nr:S8 family serine peptidase [Fodinibius sp.]NIV14397.1 S8 family serine peptidase [Fodinibius sp.]NIY28228.1 S8 family serine peptidase [Fodinibius sp.]